MDDLIMRGKYDAKVVTDFGFVPKRDDLISRAAAIEALTGWETDPTDEEIERAVKAVPAADAISVDWLRGLMLSTEDDIDRAEFAWIMREWESEQKEQEAANETGRP